MSKEKSKRIYLSPPHKSGSEQEYIAEALATNWIAPLGPNVDMFEKDISEYTGVAGAVALSSGTAAIHLALKLLGVGVGDDVFCSSLTFTASANPIVYQSANPIFIDSEPESWNMSPQALQRAFADSCHSGKLPKAVIVVNLYGQSADLQPIKAICDSFDVPIIEDAAESLGASYYGKASGSIGKFGIFSFNGNKIITTSGGGMLVSDDLQALDKARFWATQARDSARHYQHSEIGYNYRMSNILAGIGRSQVKMLTHRVAARRAIFARYFAELSVIPGIDFMPEIEDSISTRWLTAMTVQPSLTGVRGLDIIDALEEENIEARPVWKPLHLQPVFRHCRYYPHFPRESVSDCLFENGICLPSGSGMSLEEQKRVIEVVKQCIREGRRLKTG